MKTQMLSIVFAFFGLIWGGSPVFAQSDQPSEIRALLQNNKMTGLPLPQVGPIVWGVMVGIQDSRSGVTVYDVRLRGKTVTGQAVSRDQLVRVNRNGQNYTWCWFDDTAELVSVTISVDSHAATGTGAAVSLP